MNEMLKNLRRSRKWEEKIKMSKKYIKNKGRCEWNVEESEKIEEVSEWNVEESEKIAKWEEKIKMSKKYFKNEGRSEWNVEESEKIEEVRRKDKNE